MQIDDLTTKIYTRDFDRYTDLVCLDQPKGETKWLMKFAFRVFPDLCDTPVTDLSPLNVVKKMVDRLDLEMSVGSVNSKFFEKHEADVPTVVLSGEDRPPLFRVHNPTNAPFVNRRVSNLESSSRVKIALGFCINWATYWAWFNSH